MGGRSFIKIKRQYNFLMYSGHLVMTVFLLLSYFRNGWHSHLSTNLSSLNTVQFIFLIPSRHLLVTTELTAR